MKPSTSILKRNVRRLTVEDVRMMGDAELRLRLNRMALHSVA